MSSSREYSAGLSLVIILPAAASYFLIGGQYISNPFVDFLIWLALAIAGGSIAYLITPKYAPEVTGGVLAGWLVAGVGLGQTAAVVFWLLSALTVGRLLQMFMRSHSTDLPLLSTETITLGAAAWLLAWGAMLYFPVNFRTTYVSLCLIALIPAMLITRVPIQREFRLLGCGLRSSIASVPYWSWVLGVGTICWVLRWSSFPTVGYDDQALHLRLWTDLVFSHRAAFQIQDQVWAVAPFATDLLHAGLSLVAGADARGAMNLALALALLLLVQRSTQAIPVGNGTRWMLSLLFISTPMLGAVLLSLQSELLLSVFGLAGLSMAVDANEGWRGKNVMGVLAAAALCAAAKLTGAVLGAFLLIALGVRLRMLKRETDATPQLQWRALIVLAGLALLAVHSYGLAWLKTGNPFFPLYNAIFKSPFFPPDNLRDARWMHGFSIESYVLAFFKTSNFLESGDCVAGWQYLILLPPALLAVWRRDTPASMRLTLLPTLGFGLVMFAATQYWRYLFPAMPMASVLIGALFANVSVGWRTIWTCLALFCIAANLMFFPRISWLMQSPPQLAFSSEGARTLRLTYAPVASLTDIVNDIAPGSRVLYPGDTPYGATLHGRPLYVNWYAPARAARFNGVREPEAMSRFLTEERVDFVIFGLDEARSSDTANTVLRDHLASMGAAIAQAGSFILYRLGDERILYHKVFDLREAIPTADKTPLPHPPVSDAGVIATQQPEVLATVRTGGASQLRYFVRLRCPATNGSLIAQVNWQNRPGYQRLVACDAPEVSFSEAVPIPPGASEGQVYVTARETASIIVEDLVLEVP